MTRPFERPAPHHVIRGFLGGGLAGRLLDHAIASEAQFTAGLVRNAAGRRLDERVRRSRRLGDLGPLGAELAARLSAALPAAAAALGMPPFAAGAPELDMASHGDGDFFAPHVDTLVSAAGGVGVRILTGVYYLHREPRPFEGGELRLHSFLPAGRGGSHVDIAPEHDMLLFFPSWALHEVRPVRCPGGTFHQSRFSVNCWFHPA